MLPSTLARVCLMLMAALIGGGDTAASSSPSLAAPEGFALKRGVNLTGWFQFGDFDPARFGELAQIKALGLDFIRLPIEPGRFYAASPDWANLKRTLGKAGRLKLKVIVDLHPLYSTQRLALTGDARYPALLTRLAKLLPAYGLDNVALELMNEPISPVGDGCNPAFDYTPWQQKFYAAARLGSPDLTLILTGACWGGVDGLLKVTPINDPRVIYSIHNYDPMPFTHQGADWTGAGLMYTRNMPYPPTPPKVAAALPGVLSHLPTARLRQELQQQLTEYGRSAYSAASMRQTLGRAAAWAKQHRARLLLGEFGVLQTVAPPQDRLAWIRDMRQTAEALGIPQAMWDYNPAGGFGPFRGGKLERGVLEALGLKVPADAVATPPNPALIGSALRNPVSAGGLMLADFAQGSLSNVGAPSEYFAYGKPQMPEYTASPDGRAPHADGHLEFAYNLPQNDEYAGVSAVINLRPGASVDTSKYSHLQLDLRVSGGSQVRIELASKTLDDGGDHPQLTVPTSEAWETFRLPLEDFAQSGWGKPVRASQVRRALSQIIVTPITLGAAGTLSLDNLRLINVVDAGNPAPLGAGKGIAVQGFEGQTQTNVIQTNIYSYQQNDTAKATSGSTLVSTATGKALQVAFNLPAANEYAGVLATTPLQAGNAPINLLELAAVRLDLAAQGTQTLRVELQADGLDTGNDNPQVRLLVDPRLHTYRVPISAFVQAGYGKVIDLPTFLKRVTAIAVYADEVGTQGNFTLDNLMLERP